MLLLECLFLETYIIELGHRRNLSNIGDLYIDEEDAYFALCRLNRDWLVSLRIKVNECEN